MQKYSLLVKQRNNGVFNGAVCNWACSVVDLQCGWAALVPSLQFNGLRLKHEEEMRQSLLNAKAMGMWENNMLMNAYCVNK